MRTSALFGENFEFMVRPPGQGGRGLSQCGYFAIFAILWGHL